MASDALRRQHRVKLAFAAKMEQLALVGSAVQYMIKEQKRVKMNQKGGETMVFEWDEEKNQINIQKHHIDFSTAKKVFNDVNRIEIYDIQHSIDEDRYNTIGLVDDVLFVVYTERRECIRLISARLATESERRIYYGN